MDLKFLQKNWIVAAVIAILVVVAGYFVSINSQQKGEVGPAATTQAEAVKKVKASVTINPGESSQVLSSQYAEIEEGKTALDLTSQVAKVETKGEGQNAFVTGIGGRAADTAKKEFWEFTINGKPADVGAGSYKVKNGDKVEWRITTY